MNIWWDVFEIAVNIFQGLLFAFFCISVFENKRENTKMCYFVVTWASCSALLTICLYFPVPIFLQVGLVTLLLVLVTVIFCSGTIASKIFWPIAHVVGYLCMEYFIVSVSLSIPWITLDFLLERTNGRLVFVLVANAFFAIMTFVLIHIKKYSTDSVLNLRVLAVATTLIVMNWSILLLLFQYVAVMPEGMLLATKLFISAISVLFANTLVLWMFCHISEQNAKVLQLTAKEQRKAMQAKHQEEIGQIEQELRKFRHDIYSHFQYLLVHMEAKDCEKAETYLRKLVRDLDALSMTICTGNTVMDAILNVKSHIASRESIRFAVDAHLPDVLPVPEDDLVIIMSNILDNAIEASCKILEKEKRSIEVIAGVKKANLIIMVKNSINSTDKKQGASPFTGTLKGAVRGLGIGIIRDRVNARGGYTIIKQGTYVFEISIRIPIVEGL